jgi:hypothetical protein
MSIKTGGLRESPATKREIINYLKKKLSISTKEEIGEYGERIITIRLALDGETISDDFITIPLQRCSCDTRFV